MGQLWDVVRLNGAVLGFLTFLLPPLVIFMDFYGSYEILWDIKGSHGMLWDFMGQFLDVMGPYGAVMGCYET